jgi:outer membrane protein assembly factor BamB
MRHLPSLLAGVLFFSLALPSPLRAQNETAAPIYIEDSPDADDLVKQAQVLRDQNRLTEAAAMYQRVADEYPRKLMKIEGELYADAPRWVRITVAGDKLLGPYRSLHEPVAARAVEEACKPAPNLKALEDVSCRFALCEAGLEAALRAASLHLERGKPADAANLLDDFAAHPDIAKHQQRWRLLRAFSAVYQRDAEKVATLTAAMREAKDAAAIREIESLAAQLKPDAAQPARSALRMLPKVTIPQPPGKPLYVREAENDPGKGEREGGRRERDYDHPMMPTVAGETVYLNTGQTLRAVDRSSLSDIWTTPFVAPSTPDGTAYDRFGVFARDQVVRDQRGVLVDGEVVAAVMGRVTGAARAYTGMPETSLVALNRTDGKPLWRRTPTDLDPSLTASFFHGTPVGGDGRAYTMVRRTQNSGFRDAFLIAFDLRTGAMLWKRHLSSTTLNYQLHFLSQVLTEGGRLYLADNLGAVACLDGRTGGVIWFNRVTQLKPNVTGSSSATNAAWSVSPPTLIKAGLVVPPFRGGMSAMLFDPATGKKLRDLDTEPFAMAAYLMEAHGDLLSIGVKVYRIDGQTLKALWTYAPADAAIPAGRAAVTADRIIIPTTDKLITLNIEDGKKLAEAPLESPGNVLALDNQLLITSGSTVRSHMTWPVVYANLTARIRKEPTDPKPGLALANAAIASGRRDEAIEGIDHVVAVLRHRSITRAEDVKPESDEVHAETFQQLLRMGEATVTADPSLRGEVFDRIAKSTVTPRDEAQYHLAFAAHLLDTQWAPDAQLDRRREAVLHFQNVLESPLLAAQLVPRAGGRQQAGVEARMKLAGMIERFGRAVYEEFDERAAEQLTRLLSTGDPDPAQLVELTRKYPLAKAAGAALLAAGEAMSRAGKPNDAITHLRRAYREKSALPLRPRIISALVEQYVRIGKPLRARQWLQRADRDKLALTRAGSPIAADDWLAELGSQPMGPGNLPDLRTALGKPVILPGGLMLPVAQPREHWPMDRVMLATGQTVQLRGGAAFDKLWESKIEPGSQLMWLNETVALFWTEATGRLTALDARNGKRLWTDLRAQTIFKDLMQPAPEGAAQGQRGRDERDVLPLPDGARRIVIRGGVIVEIDGPLRPGQVDPNPALFQPRGAGRLLLQGQPVDNDALFAQRPYRVIINDAIICLADARGRVVGIDLDSGQVKWQFVCPFDQLDRMAINGECVAFAGGAINDDTDKSVVVALDALTGDMITQFEAAGELAWLGLNEADTLIYIDQPADRRAKSKIVTHQLPDGDQQWKAEITAGRIDAVTLAGDCVVMLVDGSDLMVIDPLARAVRDPLSSVMIDRTDGVDVAPAGDHWHLLTPQQGTALRGDAKTAWRDAIDEEAGDRVLQLIGRDRLFVATFKGDEELLIPRFPPAQRLPNPRLEEDFTVTYRLFVLDRKGGSIEHEYRLPLTAARLQASQAVLLNHRILLGAGQQTIMIPDAAN